MNLFKRTPGPLWKRALYVFGIGAFFLCTNFVIDYWNIIFFSPVYYGASRTDFACTVDSQWWDNKSYTFTPYLYNKDCPPITLGERRKDEDFRVFIQFPMHAGLHANADENALSSSVQISFPVKYTDNKEFPDFISKDIDVDQKSVHLDYMTEDGKIIEPVYKKVALSHRSDGQTAGLALEEEYSPDKMASRMKGHASFKAVVHGEHINVDKYFSVELMEEYNFWQSFVASIEFGMLGNLMKFEMGIPIIHNHKS